MTRRILPTPSDPNFTLPPPSIDEFLADMGEEDADLLATGAWDDVPDDDDVGDDDDDETPVDTAPEPPAVKPAGTGAADRY